MRIDETGNTYGRWTVLHYLEKGRWLCRCQCGTEKSLDRSDLVRGSTNSCGCLRREYWSKKWTTHGDNKTRFYNIWIAMRKRCYQKIHPGYHRYGGRGIRVLWKDYPSFKEDMNKSYKEHVLRYGEKNTTLDRIDNDGGYSKENCRWATYKDQANNRENTIYLEAFGETLTLEEWAAKTGIKKCTLSWRYKKWGPVEQVITKKPNYVSKRFVQEVK